MSHKWNTTTIQDNSFHLGEDKDGSCKIIQIWTDLCIFRPGPLQTKWQTCLMLDFGVGCVLKDSLMWIYSNIIIILTVSSSTSSQSGRLYSLPWCDFQICKMSSFWWNIKKQENKWQWRTFSRFMFVCSSWGSEERDFPMASNYLI